MKSSFFVVRVGADWFSLPEEVVIAPDVSCFKAHLDACWKNLPSIFKSFSLQMPSHACSIECYRTAIMSMTSTVAEVQVMQSSADNAPSRSRLCLPFISKSFNVFTSRFSVAVS